MTKNKTNVFNLSKENNGVKIAIILNVALYIIISIVSTIHSISLFNLFNPSWLAVMLAGAVELGQGVSLFSLNLIDSKNKGLIRTLFMLLTFIQIIGNLYYSYTYYLTNSTDLLLIEFFKPLFKLFAIANGSIIRFFTFLLAGLLPIIAILFIEILIKYVVINDEKNKPRKTKTKPLFSQGTSVKKEAKPQEKQQVKKTNPPPFMTQKEQTKTTPQKSDKPDKSNTSESNSNKKKTEADAANNAPDDKKEAKKQKTTDPIDTQTEVKPAEQAKANTDVDDELIQVVEIEDGASGDSVTKKPPYSPTKIKTKLILDKDKTQYTEVPKSDIWKNF